ncbi:MAG: peptidoglycan DD-metalloendopeptidase family protein [Hydrogenoanaerobacterium sp.]
MRFNKLDKQMHKVSLHDVETSRERESIATALFRPIDKFFDIVYRLLYFMGAQLVRKERLYSRHLETRFNRFRDKLAARHIKKRTERKRRLKARFREAVMPIVTAGERFKNYGIRLRKAAGISLWRAFLELMVVLFELIRTAFRAVGTVLNYVAPVVAVFMLVSVIQHFTGLTFALSVNYAGQNIGYITDEAVFENAEKEVKKRIVYEDPAVAVLDAEKLVKSLPQAVAKVKSSVAQEAVKVLAAYAGNDDGDKNKPASADKHRFSEMPQFTLTVIKPEQIISQDELTNRIIKASGDEITQASGIYIEGDFKGATTKPEQVLDIMNAMLNQYESDSELESIHFINKIAVKDGLYPVKSLKDTMTFGTMLRGNVSGETNYTVVEGDSPTLIADKTGVPLDELSAMNPNIKENFVPGKQLLISRSVPMMKVKVTRRETHTEEIPFETEYTDNPKLVKGLEQTVKKGTVGSKKVDEDVVYIDGISISKKTVRETVIIEPISEIVDRGTNVPKPQNQGGSSGSSSGSSSGNSGSSGGNVNITPSAGGFIWPVIGGGYNYISMPIWGYWGHTGTDIAAPSGTTVVAAMSGRVTRVMQTAGGYGKHIIIDHGNGMSTLYGHNSALYVKVGDYVQQGQRIAAVGRTGNASGNHLHFEIRSGSNYLDARKYIGRVSPY